MHRCAGEYFEEDFDYDKKLSLPKDPSEEGEGGGIRIGDFTNTSPDPIADPIVKPSLATSSRKSRFGISSI